MNTIKTKHIVSIIILSVISIAGLIIASRYIDIKHFTSEKTDEKSDKPLYVPDEDIDTDSVETDTSSQPSDSFESLVQIDSPWVLTETGDATSAYVEKIIFIGDKSIGIMGEIFDTGIPYPSQQIWSCTENLSITRAGSTQNFLYPTKNEYTSFVSAIKDKKPPYIILSFGSYCEENITKEIFENAYSIFIRDLKTASANTQIMVQSIFPVSEKCTVLTNEQVMERNNWLIEICEKNSVYYLNTWSVLADMNGCLNPRYFDVDDFINPDFYYLNDVGFKTAVQYIRCHAHPSLKIGE